MSASTPASSPSSSPSNSIELKTEPQQRSWIAFSPRGIAALFLVWLLSRWAFDSLWNLVPDEAYYWVWSQHLALSYLDHPPIVAYLIRLGTALMGNTELGVRWPAGIVTAGTVLILTLASRQVVADARALAFVPVALLLSPMVAVTGTIMTPDAPACFFQAAALAAAMKALEPGGRMWHWLLFGAFMGLGLDSKYTTVLLGLAVALAMISSSHGRRMFLSPGPWLAAAVAMAVFSPVLIWNRQRDWVSFRFQLHHGTVALPSPVWKNLLEYAGGQLLVCTPVLFVLCIAAIVIYWRRKDNPMGVRVLLFAAITPLVFFAVTAIRHRPEANWPMFAYFPAVMLFARYLGENTGRGRFIWAGAAVTTAAIFTVILHAPQIVWKISPSAGSPQWDNLYGWRELAQQQVEPLRRNSMVVTTDYEYASELSFYLPGDADVCILPDSSRMTEFDFISPPWTRTPDRLVLVHRLPKNFDPPPTWHVFGEGYAYSDFTDCIQYKDSRLIRRSLIEVAQVK
jgi:hypothetical protein